MWKDVSCGQLRREHQDQEVTLAGWVHRRRDHGGLIFVDLRDQEGLVQVVFNPQVSPEAHALAGTLRAEWVIQVRGPVVPRPPGTENRNLPTGEVEVLARELRVLNPSRPLPFPIDDPAVDEFLRLRYRYLYLRNPSKHHNLVLRHRMVKFIRDFLDSRGFVEIETPMLIKSTPEGARDYLVPSRLHKGCFYALPQSPQQLKQLLMVAGFEKYFQIARCFRDEDLRADRQPEFTQLDLEMSFVEEEDIFSLMEELHAALVARLFPQKRILYPFPRLTYKECLERFGRDKPDLRFGLELADLSDILEASEFQVLRSILSQGGVVKGFACPGCGHYTRRQIQELTQLAQEGGAQGLLTLALTQDGEVRSPLARYLTPGQVAEIARRTGAQKGDLILMVGGQAPETNRVLGYLRQELAHRLELADPNLLAFAFVVDFPLLEWNQEEGRWNASHHPFTSVKEEDLPLLDSDPGRVRSRAYDLVCNNHEVASGSIRIHCRPLQEKVLGLLGYSPEEMQARFGQLLEALDYGAPPHGGIAVGLDRLAMILMGEESLREVIAFPKTQSATDPLFGAPAPVTTEQLKELHLRVINDE